MECRPYAPRDIVEQTPELADRIIRLSFALPGNVVGRGIGGELVRAATSVGANVEEAEAGESTPDFVHKLKIARKECREAKYFLIRVVNAELVSRERLDDLVHDADQLGRILTTVIRNTGVRRCSFRR